MMEQLLDVRPEIAASQPYGLFRDNELSAANSVKTQINRMFFFRMNLRRRLHLLLQSKLEKKRFPDRLLNKIDTVYVDVLRRRRLWPLERIKPREEKHIVLLGQAVHEDSPIRKVMVIVDDVLDVRGLLSSIAFPNC